MGTHHQSDGSTASTNINKNIHCHAVYGNNHSPDVRFSCYGTKDCHNQATFYSTQSSSLSCPCSKISTTYGQFARVDYSFHQLCSSVFVDHRFWDDFFPLTVDGATPALDLRLIGSQIFQSLSAFCQMVNRTITESLTRLYSNQYVTATVTSAQLFRFEIQAVFDLFLSSTTNDLLSTLRTLRDINHANALFSAALSNYGGTYNPLSSQSQFWALIPEPLIYAGCSCSQSPSCTQQATFYSGFEHPQNFTVSGLNIGCSMTEAVLQSNLQCFYNQTCVDQFLSYLLGNSSLDVIALDQSLLVQFSVQSTVQELVNHLMVEKWNFSSSFDNSYHQCQPAQCTYSVVTRNDAINIVTILFGLVGGLSTILGVVVPVGVQTIVFLYRRRRAQVTPIRSVA